MDRDQIVDRIAHAIRMQQAVQTTSFPATPERLAEAALGVVEDTYDSSAAASAVWDQAVEACFMVVREGVEWKPEENFSDKWRKASRETSYRLSEAVIRLKRSDKTESDNG